MYFYVQCSTNIPIIFVTLIIRLIITKKHTQKKHTQFTLMAMYPQYVSIEGA